MIYFLKKYWKLIFFAFSVVIIVSITIISNNNDIKIESEKKLSDTTSIEKEKKDDVSSVLYIDIKGAILNPGVYQMEEGKRVIDVINLAGGLKDNANTANLNLSKKLTDEMYIIVYTNEELESYLKKQDNTSCVSLECICPNEENGACINNNVKEGNSKSSEIKTNGKISINNATKEELMTLSGIGEAKANNIINYRNENGLFKSIEDIKNVTGISDKIFEKIKSNIKL